jgi:hypothetical protein
MLWWDGPLQQNSTTVTYPYIGAPTGTTTTTAFGYGRNNHVLAMGPTVQSPTRPGVTVTLYLTPIPLYRPPWPASPAS